MECWQEEMPAPAGVVTACRYPAIDRGLSLPALPARERRTEQVVDGGTLGRRGLSVE
jgi:hypothetical protein